MNIGRIKEIKNIGAFANLSGSGSLNFEKLTFIYGFNTYGKTTLTDIFQSLKDNDAEIIKSRETIPEQNVPQTVIFTEKNTSQLDVKFENNTWSDNSIGNNLEIFGTNFIHKNLFTGESIKRENKENFTQFVLGEKGVKLVEKIEKKRKSLGDNKRDLKSKTPHFVKNESDEVIENFIKFNIDISEKNKITESLLQKQADLKKQKELLEEPKKILDIKEPNEFDEPNINIADVLSSINSLLQKNYSDINDEVLQNIKQHIEFTFSDTDTDNAEGWIKSGTKYCKNGKDGNCPFCGQTLKGASNLIDIYNSYFNEAYNNFVSDIERGLSIKVKELENIDFRYKSKLQVSLSHIKEYNKWITSDSFLKNISSLETKIYLLEEDKINEEKTIIVSGIRSRCEIKNKTPHKKIDIIEVQEFLGSFSTYIQLIKEIKQIIDQSREDIIKFKEPYKNTQEIQEKINRISEEIGELKRKEARINLDTQCQTYLQVQGEIKQLEQDIPLLKTELENDQSAYLDIYFAEINKLFRELGSENFDLERKDEKAGNMPVYSLKVKFRGIDIANNRLKAVFSESDRRALSLAIFLAKICLKNDDEKRECVVILDDPITSFDENRVTNSVNLFKNILKNISQMVILTHYPHFIKRFCEITGKAHTDTKYLKIERDGQISLLAECCREEFTQSDYDKAFSKIYDFIHNKSSDSIKTDLRPFIEKFYLPTVFAKQIKDKKIDCSKLDNMIDKIFDDGEVKNNFYEFKNTLNSYMHGDTPISNEDVRGFAIKMMNYLYSIRIIEKN